MSLEDKRDEFFSEFELDDSEIIIHNKPNVDVLKAESITEIKRHTLNNLLAKINQVDFYTVCSALGWKPSKNASGGDNPPTPSNYKVAIIDELMKLAKSNNWHLALDSGFFYIYTGSMWISLDKDELKNFLKDVAIKQSYPPIKAKDSKFISQLYDQAIQDGFFTDKDYASQSMINLSNCTLVLNSDGVTTKAFDYRDFLTHQLPFSYDPKAHNAVFQQYLDDVLPDKDTQRTLQETCGYLLKA